VPARFRASARWSRRAKELLVVVLATAIDLYVYAGDRTLRWGGLAPAWLVPLLTVAVFGTLLLRWRHPLLVFAIQWIYSLAGLLMPHYAPFAGLLVALHAVACQVSTRLSLGLLALCTLPFAVHNYNAAIERSGDLLATVAAFGAVWLLITAAVWAVGRRTYTANRRAQLLQAWQAQEAAEAVRNERLRLARDLHDIVTHAVSAIILQAAGAQTLVGRQDEQVKAALRTIESAGVQAMQELHRLLGLLRSVDPDGDEPTVTDQPRLQDVAALVELSRRAGLDVELVVQGKPATLDPSVDLAAYRIVQEALSNATKHGGPGALVRLQQTWGEEALTLSARSMPGLHASQVSLPSAKVGLRGLRERVSLVGGHLEAGPAGDSFVLRAELPLRRTAAERATAGRMP
jgi:signal transduction histidine kinase